MPKRRSQNTKQPQNDSPGSILSDVLPPAISVDKPDKGEAEVKLLPPPDRPPRVTILPHPSLSLPELYLDVFLAVPPGEYAQFAKLFARAKCNRADSPEESDLVVFGGGPDVNPELYGEKVYKKTQLDLARDAEDMEIYAKCLKEGIPMVGVCRGAQFGWVMNGGKLFQDVDNHFGPHRIFCRGDNRMIDEAPSNHHQACIPDGSLGAEILATTNASRKRVYNPFMSEEGGRLDIESYFFRDTGFFGVQGHPEYSGYDRFTRWFAEKLQELFNDSPDYAYEKIKNRPYLRMKEEARAARDQKIFIKADPET